MNAFQFQSLSRCWFAFPGRAKAAAGYERFLVGMLDHFPALKSEFTVRIRPTSLLTRDIAERENENLLNEQAEGRK